jgi:TPR repeat protein
MKPMLNLLWIGLMAGCAQLNAPASQSTVEETLAKRRFLTIYALSQDARCEEALDTARDERDPGMRLYYLGFTAENCEKDLEKAWAFYTEAAKLGNSRAMEEFADNGRTAPPVTK